MTAGEELLHVLTHGIGAVLSVMGVVLLVRRLPEGPSAAQLLAAGVYGGSLVILYGASSLFHAAPARFVRLKRVLQRGDHAAIYLLIAGTYTPYTLLGLTDPWSSRLFVVVWAFAAFGLLLTLRSLLGAGGDVEERRYERRSLVLYLIMGWLSVLAFPEIVSSLPVQSVVLLVAGGVAYTAGVWFFIAERKWMHTVWHGFVLAGSGLHFASIVSFL